MKLFKIGRNRGDTILEVVVAMVILSSILISTFSILNRALETNIDVKNRIIALNIAREGFEGVRNLRDTNWLKYSGDRRAKWLCRDSTSDRDTCSGGGNQQIDTIDADGKYYTIDYDASPNNTRYYLDTADYNLDLDLTSPNDQSDYLLYIDSANDRYTHNPSGTPVESVFYRQVYLETINPYLEITTAATPSSLPDFCNNEVDCISGRLKVRVSVHWLEGGRPRQVTLEGFLYDFFERNDYS